MYILFLAIVGALVFVAWALYRVAPESAPSARGAKYAHIRGCIECHGRPDTPGADSNDEACYDKNHMPWHPEYNVDCADVLAYFETVRLGKTFQVRLQSNSQNLLISGEQLDTTALIVMANWGKAVLATQAHSKDMFQDTLVKILRYSPKMPHRIPCVNGLSTA